ncbi:MAG: PstS family phosphate ABC transporter substrate-binding protein [Candidatus Accumulibacter phosphatis]|uniref:Phosphate-binding protein n=2 Tax=Candidatus Accumulibacter TaxID=327159 RepID=A0A080MFI4_9PROT|nr:MULTISPECIES: PstS family phosphate ABC transporter substrate-binding protein [Candidatus Accumulibacter]KFB76019.1 MAG: Phosphate-binding protein PstS precursor [Candidatus Accumulibacter cognatus]MCC2869119.1 PstS family phosphate ABC transporter substrate-binding protein [Candidatus Accumulibacter phosphatis]MCQ1547269.1 PstS family phosphate ABC transporter substrate-binding protein [Candidatus Accumulibacter phosphatis]HMW54276.1 PstS family phosphate ABC transporter substrate-binding p
MSRDLSASIATSLFPAGAFAAALAVSPLAMGAAAPVVKIDGSSTVYPITEAVAQDFQRAKLHEVHVNIGVSGTSAGFTKFCRGETDLSNASRPILKKEMDDCAKAGVRFYEMPMAYDALTVVVNPQNTFVNRLGVADLRKLWEPEAQNRINTWKDLNPAWPAQKINLYAPGADSGSFESFTEVVVGTAKSSRSDVQTAEDHAVLAQRIADDKDALGYLSLDYYVENGKKLKAVAIGDGKEAVLPTVANIRNGSYQPLSRPVFLYVNEKSLEKPAVKDFVDFCMKNAERLVVEANYLPLPARAYSENLERINARKVGSVYGGENKARPRPVDMRKLLDALMHGS